MDCVLPCAQIHGQAVHLLQVLPSGRLVKVQQFGRHCWDDDELILSEHAHAERRWRSSQVALIPGCFLPALGPMIGLRCPQPSAKSHLDNHRVDERGVAEA